MQETWVRSPPWEDPLEKGMATHSSVLLWKEFSHGKSYEQRSLEGCSPWGSQRVVLSAPCSVLGLFIDPLVNLLCCWVSSLSIHRMQSFWKIFYKKTDSAKFTKKSWEGVDSDRCGDREGYSFFLNRIIAALDSFFRPQTIQLVWKGLSQNLTKPWLRSPLRGCS